MFALSYPSISLVVHKACMPTDERYSNRPTLNISVVGAGISPEDIPIDELGTLLKATAALLRAVASDRKGTAPDVALVDVSYGSAAYAFTAVDSTNDATFAPLVEVAHRAVRLRGSGYSRPIRSALERLYGACTRGALEVGGRSKDGALENVVMGAPLQAEPISIEATTALYGRIVSVLCTKDGYELALKPRDGSARVELFTDADGLAEKAASLFNQNVCVYAAFALSREGKRSSWELLKVSAWEHKSFMKTLNEIRDGFIAEGVTIDSERFRRSRADDAD